MTASDLRDAPLWKDGEIITIRGRPDKVVKLSGFQFDYDVGKNKCSVCGGLGIPWAGWFTCDSCIAFAFISTGEVFVPLPKSNFPRIYCDAN